LIEAALLRKGFESTFKLEFVMKGLTLISVGYAVSLGASIIVGFG